MTTNSIGYNLHLHIFGRLTCWIWSWQLMVSWREAVGTHWQWRCVFGLKWFWPLDWGWCMEVSEVLHTQTHVLGRRGTNIASPLSLNVLNLSKSFLYLQI